MLFPLLVLFHHIPVYAEFEGHNLSIQGLSAPSGMMPGASIAFENLRVLNKGIFSETVHAELAIDGPQIHQVLETKNLGLVEAGLTKTFASVFYYTVPQTFTEGYYAFVIRVFSDEGDEDTSDNVTTKVVRIGEQDTVYSNYYKITGVPMLCYDEEAPLGEKGQINGNGGYGPATIDTDFDHYTIYISRYRSDTEIEYFIDSANGFKAYALSASPDMVFAVDDGKLLLGVEFYPSGNCFVMQPGFPVFDEIKMEPLNATVEAGTTFTFQLYFDHEASVNEDYIWRYSMTPNRFNMYDSSFGSDCMGARGTHKDYGGSIRVEPYITGELPFVVQVKVRDYEDFWVVGSVQATPSLVDSDGDTIPDYWEEMFGLNPSSPDDADLDPDEDQLTNAQEYLAGTQPNTHDTDNDQMPDGWEVAHFLDPTADDALLDKDGDGFTNRDEYTIGTEPDNGDSMPENPVADAGDDRTVTSGDTLVLDGSGTVAGDYSIVSWAWTVLSGQDVEIQDDNKSLASFVSPHGITKETAFEFKLTVTDNRGESFSDTCRVTVLPADTPPHADAGSDQNAIEGETVFLSGKDSYDNKGITSYEWNQIEGTPVWLSDPTSTNPTFVVPKISSETTLVFELTVEDASSSQDSDTVVITVSDNGVSVFDSDTYQIVTGIPFAVTTANSNLVYLVIEPVSELQGTTPEALMLGRISIKAKLLNPGDSTTITVYFDQTIPDNHTVYAFSERNGDTWQAESPTVFTMNSNHITLSLHDGNSVDDDGQSNGMVSYSFGIGKISTDDSNLNTFESDSCFIQTIQ